MATVTALSVRVTEKENYQSMCTVLAVLAYPTNSRSRIDFERALIFRTARENARYITDWRENAVVPANVLLAPEPIDRMVQRGFAIINNERLAAASTAAPFVLKAIDIEATLDGRKPTTATMLENIANQLGTLRKRSGDSLSRSTVENYWARSKSVLHLAIAYRALVDRTFVKQGKSPMNPFPLLFAEGGATWLIKTAEIMRKLLLSLKSPTTGPTSVPQFHKFGMIKLVAE